MKKYIFTSLLAFSVAAKVYSQLTFYYCGQNVDIFTHGVLASDNNNTHTMYEAEFSENSAFNSMISPVLNYVYAQGQGGAGGPYLGLVSGMKPGKTYYVHFRYQDGSNPWSAYGSTCSFNTVNLRTFNYCQTGVNMNQYCQSNGVDIDVYGVTAWDLCQSYSYYRFEFSPTSASFPEHVNTSLPISQNLSKELTPSTANNGGPYLSTVPGLQRGRAYYVRVMVRQNPADPWVSGPVCTFATKCTGTGACPNLYWQFESLSLSSWGPYSASFPTVYKDVIKQQDIFTYGSTLPPVAGQVGNCKQDDPKLTTQAQGWWQTGSGTSAPYKTSGFTAEFLLKPNKNNLNSQFYINQWWYLTDPRIIVSGTGYVFEVVDAATNAPVQLIISPGYSFPAAQGIYSPYYLFDGNWHHLAFVYDGVNKKMQVWIDGQHPSSFELNGPSVPSTILFPTSYASNTFVPNVNYDGLTDELAYYDVALPPELIYQHYKDMLLGNHYSPCTKLKPSDVPPAPAPVCSALPSDQVSPLVRQDVQAKSFPLPRYVSGTTNKRNVIIGNDNLRNTCYDYTSSSTSPTYSLSTFNYGFDIGNELYKNFNYFYPLSVTLSVPGPGTYEDFTYNKINTNNLNANFSIHTFWGFSKSNSPEYGNPTPTLSSCPTPDIFTQDGESQALRVYNNVIAPITKPNFKIDMIVEDNEVYNTTNFFNSLNCTNMGILQKNVTQHYKDGLYDACNLRPNHYRQVISSNTDFIMYQNSGAGQCNPNYNNFPDFVQTRSVNSWNYGAMDLYTTPTRWQTVGMPGSFGLESYVDARLYEISAGSKFCSPFVCANFNTEPNNMTSGQYLSLCKLYAVLGADFFNTGFFNVTQPNSILFYNGLTTPIDSRTYLYQYFAPSYAQALVSKYRDVFDNGYMLSFMTGFYPGPKKIQFVNGDKPVFVRKHNTEEKFVVAGALERYNNCDNLIPSETDVTIDINQTANPLNKDELKFNVRSQGSVYVYDKSDPSNIAFYQLDGWHQDKHFYNWNTDFVIEAELFENQFNNSSNTGFLNSNANSLRIKTDQAPSAAPGDYVNSTSYILFKTNSTPPLNYDFEPRALNNLHTVPQSSRNYYLWVRARTTNPSGNSSIKVNIGGTNYLICINSTSFKWYSLNVAGNPMIFNLQTEMSHTFKVNPQDKYVQVDKYIFSETSTPSSMTIPSSEIAGVCGGGNRIISEHETGSGSLSIYPQPSTGLFTLSLDDDNGDGQTGKLADITVMDLSGRVVYSKKAIDIQSPSTIDMSFAGEGIYFVKVICDGKSYTDKLVIVK